MPSRARSLVVSSAYTGRRWYLRSATSLRGIDAERRVRFGSWSAEPTGLSTISDRGCDISASYGFRPGRFVDPMSIDKCDYPALPTECHTSAVREFAGRQRDRKRTPEMFVVV